MSSVQSRICAYTARLAARGLAMVLVGSFGSGTALAAEYRFYHPDPLGSNSVVTDRDGGVVERSVLSPYGTRHGSSIEKDPVRHLFTDKERDLESGLDYFGARYYDPSVGRFLSLDPGLVYAGSSFAGIERDAGNLNGHAYALNRPTAMVDPTGEFAQYVGAAACGPVCIGGALVLTAGIIFMSQAKPPSNVIPFPEGRGPRGPTPTPTPVPTPPGNDYDVPEPTPRPYSQEQFLDDLENLDRSSRDFRDTKGNRYLDLGKIGENVSDEAVQVAVESHLERLLAEAQRDAPAKERDRAGGTVRIRSDDRVRRVLDRIVAEDPYGPYPDRYIEVERGDRFDEVTIRSQPPLW